MKRDLVSLAADRHDLLVIGGGITGSFIAWDAALRGLRVALIDRGDFGGQTSANSLKVVHGGLRYLQDADLSLVRRMARERQAYLRIAPHLVHPMPFLLPTFGVGLRSKPAMAAALRLNDLMSTGLEQDPARRLPRSQVLSRGEFLSRLDGFAAGEEITGGALWYDAQVENTERMLLGVLLAASSRGAHLANYTEAVGLLMSGERVAGAAVVDRLSGQAFEVQADTVVNAAGPWMDLVAGWLNRSSSKARFRPSLAMNIVTRQVLSDVALGFSSHSSANGTGGLPSADAQTLFIVPWRGLSILGTLHMPYEGPLVNPIVPEWAVEHLLDQVNRAFPSANLGREDVFKVHSGLLPSMGQGPKEAISLLREARVIDHEVEDGAPGLISALGVKYTTARSLAEKTVDLVVRKLHRPHPASGTLYEPIYGGAPYDQANRLAEFESELEVLEPGAVEVLLASRGSEAEAVLSLLQERLEWGRPVNPGSTVIRAEVIQAVRNEMAMRLSDVVYRRTDLGAAGDPGHGTIEAAADLMAGELGWSLEERRAEVEEARAGHAQMAA